MTNTAHFFILVLLIIAALVSYVAGSILSLAWVIGLGVIFEGAFWFGLFKNRKSI